MKLVDFILPRGTTHRWGGRAVLLVGVLILSSLQVPELLAFPYGATIGDTVVYAEQPIGPQMRPILVRSDMLLHGSPIFSGGYGHRLFLTSGGLRWKWLSLGSGGAFAVTRPASETIVINRSSIAHDRVFNANAVGGVRSLSGVIAHERTHGLLRARYGFWVDAVQPGWKREGYCDYIARESSLSDADVAALRAAGKSHPALVYHDGRRRVAASLAANGGNVDALFK